MTSNNLSYTLISGDIYINIAYSKKRNLLALRNDKQVVTINGAYYFGGSHYLANNFFIIFVAQMGSLNKLTRKYFSVQKT